MATQEKTWNVANRMHSQKDSDNPEVNHIIAGADEIYDDEKGAKQSEINAQTDAALADRYTKDETYSKEQLDALITTPDVNYVTVATFAELPQTGEADTIYRVSSYDGTQADASKYALYAWNGTSYHLLAVRSAVGEVFDVSEYNSGATYETLTAALAAVPASVQRGGMSIKFILRTNTGTEEEPVYHDEYVQYRLMSTDWSTVITDWQGVDKVPTPGSHNFVESGGVQKELALSAVYDVSAKNPTAGPNNDGKFESLSALLSDTNLNTLIPTSVRKGGMSIKFVQSSDNKYVQYRLTADSWSTSVADWENIKTARANIVAYQFEFTDGYYLSTNDTPVENTVFSYTGYIPVGNSCTVYLYNTIKAEDSAIRLLIYNTNKEKISSISLADKGIGVVTLGINNPNAAFIRLTTYTSKKDKFFVCVDYSSQLSATYQDINKYATLINISTLLPTGGNDGTDVYEPTNARNLVPTEKRKKGLLLTYKTTDGWIVEELNNDTFQTNDRYWNLLTKESLRNLVNYIGSYNSGHGLGYLDGEGKFVGNSFNYTEMAYIPVDEGTPIYFATGTTSSRSSICFYTDKNEASFLSAIAGDGTSNPRFAIVPSGAKYIRYSYASSVKDTFIFKMGITALSAKSDSGEDAIVAEIKGSYVDTDNTYFGYGAMANKSGDNCDFNAAFGVDALKEVKNDGNVLDTGRYNAAFGHSALKKNTTGNHNTAVGYGAGNNITTGVGNTAIGEDAMNSCGGSAEANTAVGRYSLFKVSSSHNIGIGTNAGYDVSSGTYNILLGENAGYFSGSANNVTTDTYSVFIGDRAGKSVSTPLTNAIAIGSGAKVDASNAIRLGNSSITKVETYGDLSCLRDGGGIILKSPNGTPYKITVSNSGELVVTAVS